jgi:bloom syndrome protein
MTKGLGNPITADERTAGLDEFQSDVLRDFMTGAKETRQDLMLKHSYRQAIFSDTLLREMGLQLPRSLEQMSAIKGIRPEMVERFGKIFLVLIENTRGVYGARLPKPAKANSRRAPARAVVDNEERPMDKNHQIVIDLCQSGDEQAGDESSYSFDDEADEDDGINNDDDDDDGFHTSHHFTQQLDPEVEAYNRRMAEVQGARGGGRGGGRGGDGGSASTAKAPKKPRQPRSSALHSKSKYSGVKKRSSFGGKKPKGGQRKSGANGGGSSWNGIMAMPT